MKRIYLSPPHMGGTELNYIHKAFDENWIAPLGPNVIGFEESVKAYTDSDNAVALSSGTGAIHLALKALGVSEGDVVLCSTLTFAASCNPIMYEKAVPVFIDSEEETWNMDPECLEQALEKYTDAGKVPKACIVVNLYGQSAKMDEIVALCKSYGTAVIEDAAESLGATYRGKASGTFGDVGIFSFNGNKIITTSGGGMLVTEHKDIADKCLFWATQAREQALHYEHKEIGYNYRMSNISAGIGRGQMEVLDEHIRAKKAVYQRYQSAFQPCEGIDMMPVDPRGEPNYWLSVIVINDEQISPNRVIDALAKGNIESRPLWKPMHQQPVYEAYDYVTVNRVSDSLFEKGLCLPSGSGMTIEEQDRVIQIVLETIEGC